MSTPEFNQIVSTAMKSLANASEEERNCLFQEYPWLQVVWDDAIEMQRKHALLN